MIVPVVGAQDTRITGDLPLPRQPSPGRKRKTFFSFFLFFGFKVSVSDQKQDGIL